MSGVAAHGVPGGAVLIAGGRPLEIPVDSFTGERDALEFIRWARHDGVWTTQALAPLVARWKLARHLDEVAS